MKKKIKQKGHGLLEDKIKSEDYIFGGGMLSAEVLQPDADWTNFLPIPELQARNGFETFNCTVYGTLNALEVLFKRKFGILRNDSERYVGVMAETSPTGNSPQKVIETIRKKSGLIDEHFLPFDESIDEWDEYYSPKPMEKKYIKIGKNFLKNYEVGHEWVFRPWDKHKDVRLVEALKYSPIGISVYAWKHDGKYFYKEGEPDNHWCLLYGYKDGEYWKIFDHYDDTFKKLRWDYDFMFAKRYSIKKRENKSCWQKIKNWFKFWINEILK